MCAMAPLWCFPGMEVEEWFSEHFAVMAGGVVRESARHLGAEPSPGSRQRQWKVGGAAKILHRTGENVRIVQYRLGRASLALYRAQLCALDGLLLDAHRQAKQRFCAAPWVAFSQEPLQGLRSLGLPEEVPDASAR